MNKTDVSIHFTLKGQTLEEVDTKIENWIQENKDNLPFDFSESTTPKSVLHHCFLPERELKAKGIEPEVYELIHQFSETSVCWNGVSGWGDLVYDRRYMLENLKKLNGVCFFVGNLTEGVKEEHALAVELGLDIIHAK